MAKIYYRKILRKDGFIIDNVPVTWQAETLTLLNGDNFDGYGNPLEMVA